MELFKNKYRIESTRLKGWDYSSPGAYFITIVTKNQTCYFGNVENGNMHLNKLGEIAKLCFEKIPEHFPVASLDVFVIMPNHVHGIVIINQSDDAAGLDNDSGSGGYSNLGNKTIVETLHATSLHPFQPSQLPSTGKNKSMASISPKSGSLSAIIRSFKSAVTKSSRLINPDFAWQSRFYDHIIRDEKSLNNISRYIMQNPLNWQTDAQNSLRNTAESQAGPERYI